MKQSNYPDDWPDIDLGLNNRSIKLFSDVKKLLSVNLELYADTQTLQGDIFLFNHFSRFETFIPQFLIFEKTGAYSCAIASGEFFKESNVLSNYLNTAEAELISKAEDARLNAIRVDDFFPNN